MRTRLALVSLSLLSAAGMGACFALFKIFWTWIAVVGSTNALCLLTPLWECGGLSIAGRVVMIAMLVLCALLTVGFAAIFFATLMAQKSAFRSALVQLVVFGSAIVALASVLFVVLVIGLVDVGSWFFVEYDQINSNVSNLLLFAVVANLVILVVSWTLNSRWQGFRFTKQKPVWVVWGLGLLAALAIMVPIRTSNLSDVNLSPSQAQATGSQALTLGQSDAPVHIVAFVDFTHRRFILAALQMHALMKRFPGKIQASFRNLPWDGACNPMLKGYPGPDPFACEAARTVICADRQGKLEGALRIVFENQQRLSHGSLPNLLSQAMVDDKALAVCMAAPETAGQLAKDIDDALSLELTDTPAYFINNRQIEGRPTLKEWEVLIEQTLTSLKSDLR